MPQGTVQALLPLLAKMNFYPHSFQILNTFSPSAGPERMQTRLHLFKMAAKKLQQHNGQVYNLSTDELQANFHYILNVSGYQSIEHPIPKP